LPENPVVFASRLLGQFSLPHFQQATTKSQHKDDISNSRNCQKGGDDGEDKHGLTRTGTD
ncbi:MAG TPA: hypothetical protein PLZ55_08340, partial [bacterium]|nr:hypothetical protein [bacterium]